MKPMMLAVCIALSITALASLSMAAESGEQGSIAYENAERTHSFVVQRDVIIGAPIESKTPHGDHDHHEHGQGSPFTDCSTAGFKCVVMGRTTLAVVPHLAPGSAYTVKGTMFSVDNCLRSVDGHCQVVLISGDCQSVKRAGDALECAPRVAGAPAGQFGAHIVYFIYNEDYGVTSFGIADTKLSAADRELKAREFVLRGDRGLLAP
jgi:hypothetical protein